MNRICWLRNRILKWTIPVRTPCIYYYEGHRILHGRACLRSIYVDDLYFEERAIHFSESLTPSSLDEFLNHRIRMGSLKFVPARVVQPYRYINAKKHSPRGVFFGVTVGLNDFTSTVHSTSLKVLIIPFEIIA